MNGVERLFKYRGLNSLGALKSAIVESSPDIVVPCDDGVVFQLHGLYSGYPGLRNLIEKSLGAPEMYSTIQSRGALLATAAELGIRTPVTDTLSSEAYLEKWRMEDVTVLKADGTWGGSGVEIAHSHSEAVEAYRHLSRPKGLRVAWKRLFVNHDALALWFWRNRKEPSVTIQQFIPGHPANTMFVARDGEVLASVTVEAVASQGATGAATVARLIRNPEISQAARLLARKLRLNGFHGIDFVIEHETGAAYLIEMNPRTTQLGHLRLPGQGDLAGVFTAALTGNCICPPPASDCITADTIAFFPQAFSWNPRSPYLRHGYHDVPWEEPALVRELLQQPWPYRQPIARVYHYLRPLKKEYELHFGPSSQLEPEQDLASEGALVERR